MSSMLEQAIVDAAALKEAAVKNAEQEILERYSQDIREAVDALLEQDLDAEEDIADGEVATDPESEEEILEQIPLAATEGEPACACPDEGEIITLDLAGLLAAQGDEASSHEDLAAGVEGEEEVMALGAPEEEEEIDLNETDLRELAEELKFDYEAKPTGYSSGTPVADLEQEQMVQAVADEINENNEEVEELKENLNNLTEENQKFRRIILQLKDKLDEVSVSNARLLYTNRVLENPSLNERQKAKLVETISKAQTIEKAKMIYEALQSAVDGTSTKVEKPESLNEVVSKQSTMLFSSRRDEKKQSDHVLDRMQRLAGIKHS